ncbi:MAG: serine hydrolase, partial [Saprospiraceae bacterium]|nr:serine hydrolase [Saprospiraceae bacterium]
ELDSGSRALLVNRLKDFDQVVVSLHNMSNSASKDFGLTDSDRSLLALLNQRTNVVLVVFGNPYSLRYFDKFETVLLAYQEEEDYQDLAAQAIFGANPIRGKLPVTATSKSRYLEGETRAGNLRMGYGTGEELGLNTSRLKQIDTLVRDAISQKATPGAVVLIAKDGKILFEKAYGHHTYAKKRKTQTSDIFDLASITKVLSGTMAIMKLEEEGLIDLDAPLWKALPMAKGTNKENLILRDIMAHRAGLKSWIKFYEQTISEKAIPKDQFYKNRKSEPYSVPVTERLFLNESFIDSMNAQILQSELRLNQDYKYSDLGFYLIADIVKAQTGRSIDQYVKKNFFDPMDLGNITYNPWMEVSRDQIPPTEVDKYFRRQTVWGYVHDMGAAMLGGVSGHAGLFADARDVASMMQMVLNEGQYNGQQILQPETIKTFTQRHPSCTRRAIGFDMKELDGDRSQNVCEETSSDTFGHLGFTGTAVWVDREHDLIYVFLSNRTYPSMHNFKLNKKDYRPRIQSIIYQAMGVEPS